MLRPKRPGEGTSLYLAINFLSASPVSNSFSASPTMPVYATTGAAKQRHKTCRRSVTYPRSVHSPRTVGTLTSCRFSLPPNRIRLVIHWKRFCLSGHHSHAVFMTACAIRRNYATKPAVILTSHDGQIWLARWAMQLFDAVHRASIRQSVVKSRHTKARKRLAARFGSSIHNCSR